MIGKRDYITVTESKPTEYIEPYLLAVELHTFNQNPDANKKFPSLNVDTPSNSHQSTPEIFVMLLREIIPFDDYMDIQPEFILLELYKLSKLLHKAELKKDCYSYIIDISGAPVANRHEIVYPTETPEEIRPSTYGSISCEDFFNLPIKKDFSYGLTIDIPNYVDMEDIAPENILRIFPWPIKYIQLHDKDLQLTLKIPDLDFIPSPHYVLKLIIDYHKEALEYLQVFGLDRIDLKLIDLNTLAS